MKSFSDGSTFISSDADDNEGHGLASRSSSLLDNLNEVKNCVVDNDIAEAVEPVSL